MTELTPTERRAIRTATHPGYRADIDGLRTVAVLPVVLNHAGVRGVWGGYAGVDIFFVISGFLITGILTRDLAAGRHTISEFYRRRVLRIFPALFAMLAATTALACATMLPGELVRYAKSLAATTLFGSNILFFSEAGYFAPAARVKPLLHTWSLAIEEQFYILWPLALAWIGPNRVGATKVLVLALTIVSFVVAVAMVPNHPTAAFYLLPARAWELSLGAALALITQRPRERWLSEGLGVLGLVLIGVAIHFYTDTTPFPGAAALLPCVGAALLILTGDRGTFVGRLLSLPPMTFVGKISYSLYLWHWPVIVFAELALFLPHTPPVIAGEVTASVLLAWLSWRFVERPFRNGVLGWRTPRVLLGALFAMMVALAAAALFWGSDGLARRFTPFETRVAAYQDMDHDALYRGGTCFAVDRDVYDPRCLSMPVDGRPAVLLAGDSHAAHWWPGLARHQDAAAILQATQTGCKPVLYPHTVPGSCEAFFRDLFRSWLPAHHVDRLVLAARWRPADASLIDATLADPAVRASHPVLVGPVPQFTTALPRLLVFGDKRHDFGLPDRAMDPEVFRTDRLLAGIAAVRGVPYVSIVRALCRASGGCRVWAAPGVPMQFDYGHLTAQGSIVATDLALWPSLSLKARRVDGADAVAAQRGRE